MPAPRIIARLDIKGTNVIKGIHLEGLRIVGQPGPMARRYYEAGVDEIIYMDTVADQRDSRDGVSSFSFVGYSEDAAFMVVVINAAPSLAGVSVEHTHPPQTYLIPWNSRYQRDAKTAAQRAWQAILPQGSRN